MEHLVSIPTDLHIDLVPGAIAKHTRPYPVPMIHLHAFKKELLHLVEMGVLSLQWRGLTNVFITPQKRWQSPLG
jgi:hypothetical protein